MNKLIRIFRHIIHEFIMIFMPKSFRSKLMSCKEVSLILASTTEELPKLRLFKLNMHLAICQCCTDYKTQLLFIKRGTQKLAKITLTQDQMNKIKNSKDKIINSISTKNK